MCCLHQPFAQGCTLAVVLSLSTEAESDHFSLNVGEASPSVRESSVTKAEFGESVTDRL